MALPRYQQRPVQLQEGVSIAHRASAQSTQSFVQRAEQFKNMAVQKATEIATIEGGEQAIIDVADGKIKAESMYTAYGKAYNNASRAAYQANVSMDMKNTASKLAIQYKNNPEQFRTAFDAYGKKTISGVEAPLNQAITGVAFRQYGDAAYARLISDKQKNIADSNKKSLQGYVNLMQEDYMAAVTSGDSTRASNSFISMNALYGQMVEQGHISEGEVAFANTQLQSKAYTQFTLSEFNNSANKSNFIDKFHADKHPMLNATQIDALDKQLKSRLKSDNTMYSDEQSKIEFDIKQTQIDTARAYNSQLISGLLTQESLDESFKVGDLTFTDYKRFTSSVANPGVMVDHEPTYLTASRYMAEMTEDEIVAMDNLTYATRRKLIGDKKVAESKRLKWTTTENGKESLRRIKAKFGILEGTLMAQIDFENKNMRNYDRMHQALYDSLMALPEEQREEKALSIATGLINTYDSDEERKQEESRKKKEDRIINTAKNKANTFNSGSFEVFKQTFFGTEQKPWEELLPKRYEYLGDENAR